MTRIAVNGALGQMGAAVLAQALDDASLTVVAGIDAAAGATPANLPYRLLTSLDDLDEPVDVLIDFSRPAALPRLLASPAGALVLGTTGYSDDDKALIAAAAQQRAIFVAANMSYGVAVLTALVRHAEVALGASYDVEIAETHHRRKVDAPSGTALMLAQTVAAASADPMTVITDRPARHEARQQGEIGVVSLRGGTVAGEHTVSFFGDDETIELRHVAQSRRGLASGALRATHWVAGRAPGLYGMDQLVADA